jgi:LuxR family quorum sensing-dependent transcriptional regulator
MGQISYEKSSAFVETCLTAARPEDITKALSDTLLEAEIFSWYVGSLVHESDLKPNAGYFGMPEQWRERYAEAHHCDFDQVFQHALKRRAPTTWNECRERAFYGGASKRALSVFDEAAEFELYDGFIMHTLGTRRIPGGVTFGGKYPDLRPEALPSLQMIGTYAYEGLRRFAEGFPRVPPRLTPRELEVLRWSAEGKTAWEIGEIIKMGERTVRTHQDNIKQKYQVSSIVQAAVRAALDGTVAPF